MKSKTPELGIGIVDLGLVYRADWNEKGIEVEFTTTSPSCPFGELLIEQVNNVLHQRFGEAASIHSRLVQIRHGRRNASRKLHAREWMAANTSPAKSVSGTEARTRRLEKLSGYRAQRRISRGEPRSWAARRCNTNPLNSSFRKPSEARLSGMITTDSDYGGRVIVAEATRSDSSTLPQRGRIVRCRRIVRSRPEAGSGDPRWFRFSVRFYMIAVDGPRRPNRMIPRQAAFARFHENETTLAINGATPECALKQFQEGRTRKRRRQGGDGLPRQQSGHLSKDGAIESASFGQRGRRQRA